MEDWSGPVADETDVLCERGSLLESRQVGRHVGEVVGSEERAVVQDAGKHGRVAGHTVHCREPACSKAIFGFVGPIKTVASTFHGRTQPIEVRVVSKSAGKRWVRGACVVSLLFSANEQSSVLKVLLEAGEPAAHRLLGPGYAPAVLLVFRNLLDDWVVHSLQVTVDCTCALEHPAGNRKRQQLFHITFFTLILFLPSEVLRNSKCAVLVHVEIFHFGYVHNLRNDEDHQVLDTHAGTILGAQRVAQRVACALLVVCGFLGLLGQQFGVALGQVDADGGALGEARAVGQHEAGHVSERVHVLPVPLHLLGRRCVRVELNHLEVVLDIQLWKRF